MPRDRSERMPLRMLFAVAILTVAAACTQEAAGPEPGSEPAPAAAPVELRVMQFNIEYGGDIVEFDAVPEAIRAADADVVALEEAWGNTRRVARALGWEHADPALHLVSRLPLVRPMNADGRYTYVEVEPGRVVALGNVHLTSSPFGPRRIAQGASAEEAIELEERVRMPELEPVLDPLASLASDGTPALLVGDFNAPSHLDWIQPAVGERDHVRFPVLWPMSQAMEVAGFVDTYREIHPDPVRDPGLTWPAARPEVKGEWNPGPNATADRIDFIYAAGPIEVRDSELVGERGGPGVGVAVDPWPTDHRGVISTVEVVPATPPPLVSVDRQVVEEGAEVTVRWHGPRGSQVQVVDVPAGAAPDGGEPIGDGTAGTVSHAALDGAGAREVVLVADGSEIARAPYWVAARGEGASIETDRSTYGEGDPITVRWTNGPGNRWDWVGLYQRGADPNVAWYLTWVYAGAAPAGEVTFDDAANGRWPLKPGRYTVYLLEDDGYEALAGADFSVAPATG